MRLAISDLGKLKALATGVGGTVLDRHRGIVEVYRRGAELLALDRAEIMLVAAPNIDLTAAAREGYQTAYIRRPTEWGLEDTPEPQPDPSVDPVADTLDDLATQLGA